VALPVVLAEHAARRWPGAAFGLQTQDRRGRGGVSDTVPVGHAGDADRLLGYAMIRAADAAGSWQWGDQVGTLETLVVAGSERGTGAGRELLDAARERMAEWGAQVMTISVIAGNERAERFYRREGASDYLHTLILPVRQPLSLCQCADLGATVEHALQPEHLSPWTGKA
jgi:ribosomal protein S18 acetylase RimI-like enzyme